MLFLDVLLNTISHINAVMMFLTGSKATTVMVFLGFLLDNMPQISHNNSHGVFYIFFYTLLAMVFCNKGICNSSLNAVLNLAVKNEGRWVFCVQIERSKMAMTRPSRRRELLT